jgi:hypothetical protein
LGGWNSDAVDPICHVGSLTADIGSESPCCRSAQHKDEGEPDAKLWNYRSAFIGKQSLLLYF